MIANTRSTAEIAQVTDRLMVNDDKCLRLSDVIVQWLRSGITLTADVKDFIEATYPMLPTQALASLSSASIASDIDSLVELILFPDQALQTALEPLLTSQAYNVRDEDQIAQILVEQIPQVDVHLPQTSQPFKLPLQVDTARTLVERLRITKSLTSEIQQAIHAYVSADDQLAVRVHLRNANWSPAANGAEVLAPLFQNLDSAQAEFWPFLDFILVCLEEVEATGSVRRTFVARKARLEHQLQKTLRYERQRAQHNIETLMLQGERIPYCEAGTLQQQLHMLETVLQWLPRNLDTKPSIEQ